MIIWSQQWFNNMREKNKIVANRLVYEKNNNTSCGHKIRHKLKKKPIFTDLDNSSYLINALSHKNIVRNKLSTSFAPIPSLAQLKKQVPVPSQRLYSQIFLGKIFDLEKSTFVLGKDKKNNSESNKCSPRSIKQCLQQKIMENVKRHKKKERLPRIKKAICVQKVRTQEVAQEREKFVIWEQQQKGAYLRISVNNPTERLVTNRQRRLSRENQKQEDLSLRKREKYAQFKAFAPWVQQTHKDGQEQY